MKTLPKVYLLTILSLVVVQAFGQYDQIPREHVFMEVFAGTECANLEGVELALNNIAKYDDPLLVVRHDYCCGSDGVFENEHANGRRLFYGGISDPVAYFNGTESFVGGGTTVYDEYEYLFTPMISEPTDFLLEINIEEISTASYVAHVTATKMNASDSRQMFTLQLAATVTEIDNTWYQYGPDIYRFVQLGMYPDYNGTQVDFSYQNQITIDIPVIPDSTWNNKMIHIIAFLQDNENKEVVQDVMTELPYFEYPAGVALLDLANISPGFCDLSMSPEIQIRNLGYDPLTSLLVSISADDEILFVYDWAGNVSSYERHIISLPEFTFNNYPENTVSATISYPNGLPDPYPENNYAQQMVEEVKTTEMFVKLWLVISNEPNEISWEMRNPAGQVIYSHGPYNWNGTYYDTLWFYDYGCHEFTVFNDVGDGLDGYIELGCFNNETLTNYLLPSSFLNKTSCQIEVLDLKPEPAFEVTDTLICTGDAVKFINTSFGDADSIIWYFEGGYPSTSNQWEPEVIYFNPGNFDVELKLINPPFSGTLSKQDFIQVGSIPSVTFNQIPDQCINWPPLELIQGNPVGGEYSGEFVQNGYFFPSDAGVGNHEIIYRYENEYGCSDSALQTVYVDVCTGSNVLLCPDKFTVWPNPVKRDGNLILNVQSDNFKTIKLIDLQNHDVVIFDHITIIGNNFTIPLSSKNLKPGVYLLSISPVRGIAAYQKLIIL